MTTQATVPQQNTTQPKSGVVWLASYPKSGNTWARAFLSNLATIIDGAQQPVNINSIGRFTIGENFKQFYTDRLGFVPTGSEEHRKQIAAVRHSVQEEEIADKLDGIIFVKTHNALAIDRGHSIINFAVTSGAIYIVRNPLDVAISLSHHLNKSIDEAIAIMSSLVETDVTEKRVHEVWDSWSNHVLSWTGKPHRAIYVMRYEDMLSDPEKTFGMLAQHLLLGATPEQIRKAIDWSSFVKLRGDEDKAGFNEKPEQAERFFREGRAGQWRDVLNPQQIERVVHDHREQMTRFGYLPLA